MATRPRILLLHTGGTLGMAGGPAVGAAAGAFSRTLRERIPELASSPRCELELFSNVDSARDAARVLDRSWRRCSPAGCPSSTAPW